MIDDGGCRVLDEPGIVAKTRRLFFVCGGENPRLPRRPWYKHLLYAPGVYTGYGVKTVPGVREGIEQKRYSEAEQEVTRVAKTIENEAAIVDSAAAQLEQLGR